MIIKNKKKIQQQLYRGELGLQSTTKMEHLDDLIINKDCRFDDNRCETIEEMPDIGIIYLELYELLKNIINLYSMYIYIYCYYILINFF